jgi:hypothetical protein
MVIMDRESSRVQNSSQIIGEPKFITNLKQKWKHTQFNTSILIVSTEH